MMARPEGLQLANENKAEIGYPDPMADPRYWGVPHDLANHLDGMAAYMHSLANHHPGKGTCYFIGGEDGPVKIGQTTGQTRLRLKELQIGSPVILSILAEAPGGILRESAYHAQYDEYRLHGEWFTRVPAIKEEIERLNKS